MALHMEFRETVAAPPERVFAALSDPAQVEKWMTGLVRFERLTDGPLGKGTKLRQVRKMFGREAAEVFEVTEYDPPRAFGLFCDGRLGSSKKGEYRFRYVLEPRAGGTEVLFTGDIGGIGRFMEFIGRLFMGFMCKALSKDMREMKAYVEGGGKRP